MTIQTPKQTTQGFKITRNENSPWQIFFQFNFCLPPLGFELTAPGFEVGCDTTELRNRYTKKFVTKLSKSYQLSSRVLDFKSRGREFESQSGQTKIDLKKILPWRILISSDFEPCEVCMVIFFANYFLYKSILACCEQCTYL